LVIQQKDKHVSFNQFTMADYTIIAVFTGIDLPSVNDIYGYFSMVESPSHPKLEQDDLQNFCLRDGLLETGGPAVGLHMIAIFLSPAKGIVQDF